MGRASDENASRGLFLLEFITVSKKDIIDKGTQQKYKLFYESLKYLHKIKNKKNIIRGLLVSLKLIVEVKIFM